MKGLTSAAALVCALLLAGLGAAQDSANGTTVLFPLVPMENGALTAESQYLDWLDGRQRVVMVENRVPGALDIAFELQRIALPAADGALHIDGELAGTIGMARSPDLSVWKGKVANQPASDVFLVFSSAGTWGWARLENGRTVHLVSGSHPELGWDRAEARWVDDAAMLRPGYERRFACEMRATDGTSYVFDHTTQHDTGGESNNEHVHTPAGDGGRGGNGGGAPSLFAALQQTIYVADAVIETDHAYYTEFNSTTAATNYANALIAACSDRFESQVGCRWNLSYFALYTSSSADPFAGTSPSSLLAEMKSRWNGPGNLHQQGDFGMVLSGHGGGGIAYVGTLCSSFSAVGACCSINGNTPFPVTGTSSFNWDFIVLAHEAGHLFNSPHTHNYCPPLDLCDDNCNGTVQCSLGTIMSYCHTCSWQGVKNLSPYFHQTCADRMRDKVTSVSCLAVQNPLPPAPVIASAVPSTVAALSPDAWPTIVLTGQNFSNVNSVLVDGVPLTTSPQQYTIVNSSRIDIPWTPKNKLGAIVVRVGNAGGFAETTINVVPNAAPAFDVVPSQPAIWIQSTGLQIYMAGPSTNLFYLAASTSGLPTILPGVFTLNLGNNLTDFVNLGIWSVDPVKGYRMFQTPINGTSLPIGTVLHLQAVIVSSTAPQLPFPVTTLQRVTVAF